VTVCGRPSVRPPSYHQWVSVSITVAVLLVADRAMALSCHYSGNSVAASHLGLSRVSAQSGTGSCDTVQASIVAAALLTPLYCRVELLPGRRLQAPWKLSDVRIEGDPYLFTHAPSYNTDRLSFELSISAPRQTTYSVTLMWIEIGQPGNGVCPTDLSTLIS
jgi:hypothetical protein